MIYVEWNAFFPFVYIVGLYATHFKHANSPHLLNELLLFCKSLDFISAPSLRLCSGENKLKNILFEDSFI